MLDIELERVRQERIFEDVAQGDAEFVDKDGSTNVLDSKQTHTAVHYFRTSLAGVRSKNNTDNKNEILETKGKNSDPIFHRQSKKMGKLTEQYEWFAEAALLVSEGEEIGACKPAYNTPETTRKIRKKRCAIGWRHHRRGTYRGKCVKKCELNTDGFTTRAGVKCWQPCDREGQLTLHRGCGKSTNDRTCEKNIWDCAWKYVNRVISIIDVLTTILSGGVAGAFKTAIKAAVKAGSKALAKKGVKAAVKAAAKEFAEKLKKNIAIQAKKMKYWDYWKEEIDWEAMQEGAELFVAASVDSIDEREFNSEVFGEIAEILDPTGIYSLVKGFIPPESCNKMVYLDRDIPPPDNSLPDIRALDALDEDDYPHNTVYIQSIRFGSYISVNDRGDGVSMKNDQGPLALFQWKPVTNDGVHAIKSLANEKFLSVRGDGPFATVNMQGHMGSWEVFRLTFQGGISGIKSEKWGTYLRATPDGELNTQEGFGSWEQFKMIPVFND